jgi:hypothetical protein
MIALANLAFATTVPEWTKWWMLAAIGLQLTMVGALALPTRDGRIWEGFVDPEVLRRAEGPKSPDPVFISTTARPTSPGWPFALTGI